MRQREAAERYQGPRNDVRAVVSSSQTEQMSFRGIKINKFPLPQFELKQGRRLSASDCPVSSHSFPVNLVLRMCGNGESSVVILLSSDVCFSTDFEHGKNISNVIIMATVQYIYI